MIGDTAASVLRRLDPETAHDLAIRALGSGFVPGGGPHTSPRLATALAGLKLANPIGLAAGFDKNARVYRALYRLGFAFVETGTVTPLPQPGNPRPRLFRLSEDEAIINRFGFNSDGLDAVAARLDGPRDFPLGLNLGANKASEDRVADYVTGIERAGALADYITVNISSPNTEGLRALQAASVLADLLERCLSARNALQKRPPLFLKIAPDLTGEELDAIADAAIGRVDGMIATNTTVSRPLLASKHKGETGGLSGAPLFDMSTAVLAHLHRKLDGAIPLVGVGGIRTADDAIAKIRAGATAVQIYSAMIYEGPAIARRIAQGLDGYLESEGIGNVADIVGTDRDRWSL